MIDLSEPIHAPDATVFEFLRRLRNGEDNRAAELSSREIVEKIKGLGLSETIDQNGHYIYYAWGEGL